MSGCPGPQHFFLIAPTIPQSDGKPNITAQVLSYDRQKPKGGKRAVKAREKCDNQERSLRNDGPEIARHLIRAGAAHSPHQGSTLEVSKGRFYICNTMGDQQYG